MNGLIGLIVGALAISIIVVMSVAMVSFEFLSGNMRRTDRKWHDEES